MKFFSLLAVALTASAAAVPVSSDDTSLVEKRADRGSYTVSGLGSRKQAILNAGGNTLDIAIAMLETERMSTDYVYGKASRHLSHGFRALTTATGDAKTADSANFGLFKQNWGMLRECASRAGFKGQSTSQWNNGAKLKYVAHAIIP
jgi:hypothetical protein